VPAQALLSPRRPACPDFPERKYLEATVVCEGPSACRASPTRLREALLPGPVIAVNRALAFSQALPIDVWATMDDPRFLWGWGQEHLHGETKLFSGNDVPNIWLWRELLGETGGDRLYARPPTYMGEDQDPGETPPEALLWSDGKAPMVPTIFHALAWLLQVGVKRVRLIGCDMQGSGSPIGPDWNPEDDEGHALRWAVERYFMAHSFRHYRAKGARIERCRL
jgi:hypothetical protein